MPREPQITERPPPPAPEHRAQRIGDLLERKYMPTSASWKEQSYEKLFDSLLYDSTREDEYRTRMLRLFSIEYRWVGGPGRRYADIDLQSQDMGYLTSHDMSMPFSETDASEVINQLRPSKARTNSAAEESLFRSRPSSLTAGIRIPDIAIVFSYVHPKAEAEGSESKSTGSEKKAIRSQSIWLAAEFKVYELLRNGLPSNPSTANSRSKVCLGQCLMHLDAGYQMFRLLRALAVCGTRFARVWTLSNRPGGRTFAVETSRPLGNSDPMVAADFFNQVNLDLFPHNLIIPSPSTDSFAIDYQKCELLERTLSRVCDSILSHTIESALQPRYEGAFDHGTEADPSAFTTEFLRDVEEFACKARPTLKKRRAGKEEVAQDRTFQRRDGSGGGSNQGRDSDNGEGLRRGGGKRVRRGGSGQNSQTKDQVQGGSGQSGQNKDQVGTKNSGGWEDGLGEKERSLDPLLKVVEKQDRKQYFATWQSQLPSSPSSYYPLPSNNDRNKDKEAIFIDYTNTMGRSTYYQVSFITRAVEMLKMEIIPISTARMDNLYSGQITSQHVLADPGWDAAISEPFSSRALQTLPHNKLLPVLPLLFPHKPPISTISGSENAKNPPGPPL
ncbi:hypothetical protein C367_00012 [Cryptococcus neoformans Ze90-1]|nr:hypothetical protein C367_00012 [Cryptococcus neoformans var. grubii Ze90-1]